MTKRALVAVIALLCVAAVAAGLATPSSARSFDTSFRSKAVGTLRFEVYLPAGYAQGTKRYPVIYFLHGLPAGPESYRGADFVEAALESVGASAIVIAPQGATAKNPDPEYLGAWEQAIAEELPRVVDARFRTVADRTHRALIGVSAGGYGAMLLGLHHLDKFAAVESWSGYFHPTNPDGTAALDLGSTSANARASAHTLVPKLKQTLASQATFIAFYVGDADDRFLAENRELNRELTEAGVPHVFRVYSGGHDPAVWRAHAPAWLALALNHLG
jgi:enterochelin esterase-like enzyme